MDTKYQIPTCHYLYGVAPKYITELADLPYKQALITKVNLGKQLMTELMSLHFMQQDTQRINKVANAIKFNQELLAELNYHD